VSRAGALPPGDRPVAGNSRGRGAGGGAGPVRRGRRQRGAETGITVVIPAGWHQVIDSANPSVPEMVAPDNCAGRNEVSCALGLTRLADLTAPSAQAAAQAVRNAVDSGSGVTAGATVSSGPHQVAGKGGYLLRFRFTNGTGALTAAIAAAPDGTASPAPGASASPDSSASASPQFAVVLVWISGNAGAPGVGAIDQIIGSAALVGG
jgi:hypothetical protein